MGSGEMDCAVGTTAGRAAAAAAACPPAGAVDMHKAALCDTVAGEVVAHLHAAGC